MEPIISTESLSVNFRGTQALKKLSLVVQPGRVFALIGENGAGKTTLIRVLTGFQAADSGIAKVLGLNPTTKAQELRRRIGYVSDNPALYDWMRVGEIGWFASSFYEEGFLDRYRESISRYRLDEQKKVKQLSKGQRAKVALSLAISHDPELLILDEPTSGLDPLVRREFLESMIDRVSDGRTVLLSSHQIDEVQRVADDVAFISQGQLRAAAPLEQLRKEVQSITVDLDDSLRAVSTDIFDAEVLSESSQGRQRRWVVRGDIESIRDSLAVLPGVSNVRVTGVSIEDLFVAYSGHSDSQNISQEPAMSLERSNDETNVA